MIKPFQSIWRFAKSIYTTRFLDLFFPSRLRDRDSMWATIALLAAYVVPGILTPFGIHPLIEDLFFDVTMPFTLGFSQGMLITRVLVVLSKHVTSRFKKSRPHSEHQHRWSRFGTPYFLTTFIIFNWTLLIFFYPFSQERYQGAFKLCIVISAITILTVGPLIWYYSRLRSRHDDN